MRFLLDTNVLSEPARIKPNQKVMESLAKYDGQYTTSVIVWHELQYGCALLAESKRKKELQNYLSILKSNGLVILPYDHRAAEWFAEQRARLKEQGKVVSYADGEIAAIAAVNDLTLVTCNTRDFKEYRNLGLADWFD